MIVLGIETATSVCSVGLVDGDRSIVRTIREDRVHSEKLLTLVDEVLREGRVVLSELDAVAVSSGPGSFTGLRIGVSAAKGLVAAIGKPLVAVSTLAAGAIAARAAGRIQAGAWLAMDARQGEWYAALCDAQGVLGPVAIMADADLQLQCAGREVLTDRPASFRGAAVVSDLLDHLKGHVVAMLGRDRLQRGEHEDVTTFEPMYLKAFEVRTSPARVR
ncbi:MAG: tRNA (adenosine(37)-N6)-threonylcarbamoyltransferase complex dimerization subunit type 1 TsaB [Bacteroidetes bacterium]|jgi:tRNA threonylcarbamoyladenosine biosynthesis protein TsaB|nr:tRNA (adenosine(37)-N6)-threonylcarbamoyltransferase complex dimerization subunit type 1 TsaB [Bacteroidota bacterium]